jgi:uncharacterized protein
MKSAIALPGNLLRRLILAWPAALLLALALPGACGAAPAFAPLKGYIVDEAQALSPHSATAIASELSSLEAQSSDQLFVYIAKSLQGHAIEDFGYQLGRAWGAGRKSLNNGVVLIVAPSERRVRIEVGRGLEPYLTDAMSTLIVENTILPAIREGKLAEGILKGVQDISKVLLSDQEAARQRAKTLQSQIAWSLPPAIIPLLFAAIFTVIFIVLFYANLRSLRAERAKEASREKRRSGKAQPAPLRSEAGQTGTWRDIPLAFGITLLQFITAGNSGSRSSGGSSGSGGGGGGGGGDFGGGGASGRA